MGKYLVTAALPYANGPIHIGHLAGAYLPADIYVRYRRMKGDDVIFICGTDEHGVPITLRAEKEGKHPREVVEYYHKMIKKAFDEMRIEFDNFSGTARPVHYKMSQKIFLDLYNNGYLYEKEQEQFYCEHDKKFLPDRYIIGICPYCGYERARGDQCENCGRTLDPIQLKNPRCAICGNVPVLKTTKHLFFKLSAFEERLRQWLETKSFWKPNVLQFALSWLKEGLKDRAITRDLEWGIPVPLEGYENKVMYVWFEAPIGYISSTVEWAEKIGQPEKWKEYWFDPETKLIHFIGKDNIPFHAIIWPATLMGQNDPFILPYNIPANEYMNLENEKISTSRNWAIWVHEYLQEFPPDPLRYYISVNMPEIKDADFSWRSFQMKNNEELSDNLGNFINRVLKFIHSYFKGKAPKLYEEKIEDIDRTMLKDIEEIPKIAGEYLEKFEFKNAIRTVMQLSTLGNRYIDITKPWEYVKKDFERASTIMAVGLKTVKTLALLIYPFMPSSAEKLWNILNEKTPISKYQWDKIGTEGIEEGRELKEPEILFPKISDEKIEAQINKLLEETKKIEEVKVEEIKKKVEEKEEYVTIEEFRKIDLRVGRIIEAERIKGTKKLILMKVNLGDEERTLVGGLAEHYTPEELVGKKVIVVANLKPTEIRGYISQGMLLAAEDPSTGTVSLLTIDKDVPPGSKIY